MEIKTPEYNLRRYPNVYEPSEDSFLLLDALELEAAFLADLKPKLAVEIGTGSGVVITALAGLLGSNCAFFGTDVNREACEATKSTAKLNWVGVECVNGNLVDCFRCKFDLIVFNPPYVVTEGRELEGVGLNRAWAGGANGREVTDRVLDNLDKVLAKTGVCYVVFIKENKIDEVIAKMEQFRVVIVSERKIRGEHLYILKFTHL